MSRRKLLLAVLSLTAWAGVARPDSPPGGLTDAEFVRLHKQLQPPRDGWSTIPWQVSVPHARRLAVKEKKPVLVWAQNGHPLAGC
jgi:hypothetical protein